MGSEEPTCDSDFGFDSLIADARTGSAAALDRLIELLSDYLSAEVGRRRHRRGLGPSRGLSDLVQDTLIKVRTDFLRFERDTFSDFKQWARTILYRRWNQWARNYQNRNDKLRKERIFLAIRERREPASQCQDEILQRRQEAARFYELFQSRLRPNERFIIEFRLFKGMRFKDIATIGRTSEDAAGKAYARAMNRLRQLYESNGK